jgi:FAD binding domain/Berberine and berberine like
MPTLSKSDIDPFKATLRGQLIMPDDAGYDEARTVWNAMIDRRPAMIVRCAGVADVRCAVNFARDQHLPLAIRGGGHNIAGSAMCDDGLVIDLSKMKSVRVDPFTRRAYVEPGCTLGDLDHETQAFGLAVPAGINSTTGIAGLTLGGGFGWLSRRYGMTIDSLVSADIVTADGELLHCSRNEHKDLFWAICGGGGNFGVVTMFEFQLHPVGPLVYGGLIVLPIDQGKDALRHYREVARSLPDELTVWVVVSPTPPLPFLPGDVHGKPMIGFAVCYTGPLDNGPCAVEAMSRFGTPYGMQLGPMPFTAWQQAFDTPLAPGGRNYWKSHNLSELQDGLIDTLIDAFSSLDTPEYEVLFGQLGGATARIAADATAYSARDTIYVMNIHARWSEPADDARCIGWARTLFENTKPFALGSVYVNFMTEEETDRVGSAYGPNYPRLVTVKNRYDRHNLFRKNQNIQPSRGK